MHTLTIYWFHVSKGSESVMARSEKADKILQMLRRSFGVPRLPSVEDPFKVLVRTVISQSTAETNTRRAYQNLSERFQITPEALSKASIKEVEDALRVAGLYRNKSRVLKEIARRVLEEFSGSLDFIYSTPLAEARRMLMELPGVGFKTADIVLLFCAGRPVLPVDTHVKRVSKRLGLAPSDGSYEDVRLSLQRLYEPKEYFDVHMLLIALGRKYCKALKPSCPVCPVRDLCPSASV